MFMILSSGVTGDPITGQKLTHVDREASVLEASRLMRKAGVQELLVTTVANGMLLPLGIVTANDIVSRVVAAELDPAVLTAGDIAWSDMAPVGTGDNQAGRPRRSQAKDGGTLAVLDGDGRVVATVRLDDHMGTIPDQPGTR